MPYDIYKDISERTGGDIYIGVVGPVRTGKSTFIKRFADLLVLPNIESAYARDRARDELPQSAEGRTIMTTEPKFVPSEAVEIALDASVKFKVRLIDCVGYLVPGASGYLEGAEGDEEGSAKPRMVSTPWSDEKIPFAQAAEIGTKKVITDHSTIGVVVTTDGSIAEIPRESYVEAEGRCIDELKALGKPFVVVLNTQKPFSPETDALKRELEDDYGVPVLPLNCAQLKSDDITSLMESALYEFPVREVRISLPGWFDTLPVTHWLKRSVVSAAKEMAKKVGKLRDIKGSLAELETSEYVKKAYIERIMLGEGCANVEANVDEGLFFRVLSETTDMEIHNEYQLISIIKLLSECKREYDKVKYALEEVNQKGYGIVTPATDELRLEEPKLVKHGSRYGVKLKASAPSIHVESNKQKSWVRKEDERTKR